MTEFKRTRLTSLLAAVVAASLTTAPALAQRSLTVASPSKAVVELTAKLAPAFQAETGIEAKPLLAPAADLAAGNVSAGVVLEPDRFAKRPDAIPVFRSEVVLVGLRGDRARVRGLRDLDKALRWISAARTPFVQSSEELGVRQLELDAWERIGVDVRARPRWYDTSRGGEESVAGLAADLGAYTMMEEASWAGLGNRRGVEVLVTGDPRLQTVWTSATLAPSREAAAWQAWIVSDAAREAIGSFRHGGVSVFGGIDASGKAAAATD